MLIANNTEFFSFTVNPFVFSYKGVAPSISHTHIATFQRCFRFQNRQSPMYQAVPVSIKCHSTLFYEAAV